MSILTAEFLSDYDPLDVPWGPLGYVVYKRTYAREVEGEDRREEWPETIARVIQGANDIGAGLNKAEAERLFEHLFYLRGSVGGRMLWQLGTANVERFGGDSLVNCWYTELSDVADFGWMFDRLMLGGGVGFSIKNGANLGFVEDAQVTHEATNDADFIVPDKREGWAELLMKVLRAYLNGGESFTYSTVLIRPEGTPIKTFGGKASGPAPLVQGVDDIQTILSGAVGRVLRPVEVLDIANIIGSIVVSGNVRRSAQIAIGDGRSPGFLDAKRWDLGDIPTWRAMSNNSVDTAHPSHLPEAFWEGYQGNGEAYGLLNTQTARQMGRTGEQRPDRSIMGFNPCAEIALADRESCNLAEIFLPRIDGIAQMTDLAMLLYKVQKAVAALPYLDPRSNDITHKNMRLGLGVSGTAQATDSQRGYLDETYRDLSNFDEAWSEANGWPMSARLTTVKPSGTLSLLAGVTPGIHPAFSRFHIRRVRMASNDPVFDWCREMGFAWEWQRNFDGSEDVKTAVVEFPVEYPEDTMTADKMTAIEMLEEQAWLQATWADNAVSVTVYYAPEELPEIRAWLDENWHKVKSVSFLLKDDHGFAQAPIEAITQEEYIDRLKDINSHRLMVGGGESVLLEADCEGGSCPIR